EPALHDIGVHQPERAGEERAFTPADAVVHLLGRIAQHEAVLYEFSLDSLDRAGDARIISGKNSDLWNEKQGGIERIAAIVLDEGVAPGVEAVVADVAMDLVADRAPAIHRTFQAEILAALHRAIEGDPAHQARMGEYAGRTAHLPYAMVRLAPYLLDVLEQHLLEAPGVFGRDQFGMAR